MHLEVQEVKEAGYTHTVEIENKAFRNDTEDKPSVLFPGPFPTNATELRVNEMIQEQKDDPSGIWLKVVDTEAADPNKGIAYAKWHIYKDTVAGPRPVRDWSKGGNVEACNMFFGSMADIMQRYVGGKHCLFLNILVTDPDYWRRGAGSMLVKWGTDLADEYGIPAYLESTESGRRVYTKWGFQEKEVLEVDLSKFGATELQRAWIMYYEPKAKGST